VAENPYRTGAPLRLGLEGLHAARRGDYRVIYTIDDGEHVVRVVTIEHRSDAYRRRRQ
jgi:mRNA interferase RelE/StbE